MTTQLERFCKQSGTRTGLGNTLGKYRHVNEGFAIAAWFREISNRLGPDVSQAELERRIEQLLTPDRTSSKSKSASATRRRKWRGYRDGRHFPSDELVAHMDSALPGTGNLLKHIFFAVTDARSDTASSQALWRCRLRPEEEFALLVCQLIEGSAADLRFFDRAELFSAPPLDCLAVHLIALRLAIDLSDHDLAFVNGFWFAAALVFHWKYLLKLGIAFPLTDYLGLAFFDHIRSTDGLLLRVHGEAISSANAQLLIELPAAADEACTPQERTDAVVRLFTESNGKDSACKYMPPVYFANGALAFETSQGRKAVGRLLGLSLDGCSEVKRVPILGVSALLNLFKAVHELKRRGIRGEGRRSPDATLAALYELRRRQ